MVYRTVICVLLFGVVGVALGCSLFGQTESEQNTSPNNTTAAISPPAHSAPAPYYGPHSIEERILSSVAIVKARLTNITTEVVTTTVDKWDEHYYVAVQFHVSVSEYLYGSGADNIIAYWVSHGRFNSAQEAENSIQEYFLSRRDAQWDNRDAVLFLGDGSGELFPALTQPQNVYLLGVGGPIRGDTSHFLDDRYERRWLPAASATTTTSPTQEFLLEQPVAGTTPATITLADLKAKIATIVADINASDGSKAYQECLEFKYREPRREQWIKQTKPQYAMYKPDWDGRPSSGLPAGTELYKYPHDGYSKTVNGTKQTTDLRLDGEDAALFSVEEINHYLSQDNTTSFDYSVVSVRPIPAGTYQFNLNYRPTLLDCGNTLTFALTATVTAPSGTLHELFFDPVAVGTTVTADDTNGLLSPATFTDANGASATIRRIEWQSGKVKLAVTPHTGLAGHVLDVIELDGTVSLSMDVADATVDAANDTLSWSVSSAPWEDGDKLMVRIREDLPSAPAPVDVAIDTTDSTDIGEPAETQAAVAEPRVESSSAPSVRPYISASSSGISRDPPTLEERILQADAIVRARFRSVEASSRLYYDRPFNKNRHISFVEFTFDVLETLKGNAGAVIVVELQVKPSSLRNEDFPQTGYSDTQAGAIEYGRNWIANDFDFSWNSREAVLFLKTAANSSTLTTGRSASVGFVFVGPSVLDADAILRDEISIASSVNKVWLPSKDETGSAAFLLGIIYLCTHRGGASSWTPSGAMGR